MIRIDIKLIGLIAVAVFGFLCGIWGTLFAQSATFQFTMTINDDGWSVIKLAITALIVFALIAVIWKSVHHWERVK